MVSQFIPTQSIGKTDYSNPSLRGQIEQDSADGDPFSTAAVPGLQPQCSATGEYPMELRHLRYFCAVAEFGTFHKASQQLHVSQSAISEQIADLEREIGGPLLDRSQRSPRLTPQGELFLTEARKTLLASERAIDITRRSLKGEVGTLAIGFFLWGAGGFFARIIREYRKLYPEIRLSLYEMHTWVQMDALLSGKIDVGFTRPLEAPFDRTLRAELLYSDPVVVALPVDHPLVVGAVDKPVAQSVARSVVKSVPISALAAEPFVMCDRAATPTLFDGILTLCSKAGFSPRIVNSSSTWSGVLTLVESGEGIALVPSGARHLRTPGVTFAAIQPETTHIGISIAWNPERENPIQRDFLKLVLANKDRIQRSGGY
jgi:DNA-binding transcriptional LysR family regulator